MVDKLKIRTIVKRRKPQYKRVQSHQFSKLKASKWRRPKGMGNKVRRQRRGKLGMLQVGYKSPKEVRGLNREGLREILISNTSDLLLIEKGCIGVISSGVGAKKKLTILEEAKKKSLKLSNVKDIDLEIKKLTKTKKKVEKKTLEKKEVKKETKTQEDKMEVEK